VWRFPLHTVPALTSTDRTIRATKVSAIGTGGSSQSFSLRILNDRALGHAAFSPCPYSVMGLALWLIGMVIYLV